MKIEIKYPDQRDGIVVRCDSWDVEEGGVLCAYLHTDGEPEKVGPQQIPAVRVAPPYTAERID